MTKIELSLTNSQVEEIKKVPIEKTPIYMELFSKEWVKDLKLSKRHQYNILIKRILQVLLSIVTRIAKKQSRDLWKVDRRFMQG